MTQDGSRGPVAHGDYRPDIDGLRAIAILSVVLFHLSETLVPGGFVGVDIFFVLSGFLITKNILSELEAGRFTLREFYRRRIKRIAPAMLVVVGVTLVVTQTIMLPEAAEKVAESAAWSVASLANVYFWRHLDTSYFAPGTDEVPLLHLWSLGVEEQFYILWPLLLLAFFRKRWLPVAIVATVAGSIGLAEYLFPREPMFTYYMLPTRAGELMIGAFAARLALAGTKFEGRTATFAAAGGIVLIAASLWLIREGDVFPGLLCLPPTLGAALLLLSPTGPVARVLSLKPIRWIGLVSYSAYLWHWPIFALCKYGNVQITPVTGAVLVVAIFALAWLTYKFVEQPARNTRAGWLRVTTLQFAIPAFLIVVACGVSMKIDGHGVRYFTDYRAKLESVRHARRPAYDYPYVCQRQRLTDADASNPSCVLGMDDSSAPTAILWGDSNAAHYVGMVSAIARQAGYRVRNLEHGACPPIDGDPQDVVEAGRLADCRASLAVARPTVDKFETVIVSASWLRYGADYEARFRSLVTRLTASGKHVIILGKTPVIAAFDSRCAEKAVSFPGLKCAEVVTHPTEEIVALNQRLRALADELQNVDFFDATDYLCPAGTCSTVDASGEFVYYDRDHLTIDASWRLGERILAREGVPKAFRAGNGAGAGAGPVARAAAH